MLKQFHLKTGLFVSPHISSFRERIQVDLEPISEEIIELNLPKVILYFYFFYE